MNPKQLYLGWVRTNYPTLYYKALNQVFSRRSGLMGLGDDLTDSISDPTESIAAVGVGQDTTDAINNAYVAAQQDSSSAWDAVANAISTTANAVVQTQAAENLLQINTQRAKLGLPLYTSGGAVVTPQMLSPTSGTLAQMEAVMSGSSGSLLLMGLLGITAVAVLMGGRSSAKE